MNDTIKLSEYRDWLRDLKQQIKTGQIKAMLSVNSQMIMLYWDMGRQIAEKQEKAQWGSGFIEQLSKDLREEFPDMTGFSYNNLLRMKNFYQFYSSDIQHNELVEQPVQQFNDTIGKQILAQLVPILQHSENHGVINMAQLVPILSLIPCGHHIKIMQKVKDQKQALFYINKTIENNWSRAVLEYQIETNLYGRQGKAVTNFNLTLPAPQSDLANEMMKSPYNFAFIRMSEKVRETDYDKPTIGMLLCKNKDNYEVEFSLKDINNPIGVSTFHYTELADDIKAALPSAEELQSELLNVEREHEAKSVK